MDNQYRYLGDVTGAKSGKAFGVWWFKAESSIKGTYEVKAQAGSTFQKGCLLYGSAKDEYEALQKAQQDVAEM